MTTLLLIPQNSASFTTYAVVLYKKPKTTSTTKTSQIIWGAPDTVLTRVSTRRCTPIGFVTHSGLKEPRGCDVWCLRHCFALC